MKKRKQCIQLLSMVVLLFVFATACDKSDTSDNSDNLGGDFPSAGTVQDADGNIYNTVKIGNQVWMVENLRTTKYNDGTEITNVKSDGHTIGINDGAYSNYGDLESNTEIYGRLYNWFAVGTGKLAPVGWRVPTDADWTILENYLIANGYNYDGTKVGNKIAKTLCAKTNWELSSNTGSPGHSAETNNSSGFKALPGGYRDSYGFFYNVGKSGHYWTSTLTNYIQIKAQNPYHRLLYHNEKTLYRGISSRNHRLSVRLVKD